MVNMPICSGQGLPGRGLRVPRRPLWQRHTSRRARAGLPQRGGGTDRESRIVTFASQRILVTHAGSLPRQPGSARLEQLLTTLARGGQLTDHAEFASLAEQATDEMVTWQARLGIDYMSTGEAARCGFIDVRRLRGFAGPPAVFSNVPGVVTPPTNSGPVEHDPGPITEELAWFTAALDRHGVSRSRGFIPSPSPGVITAQGTSYYRGETAFLDAVTEAMSAEYRQIADAGLVVQLDAPDLALDWYAWHDGQSVAEFQSRFRDKVDAINAATAGIPQEQVRVHVCHGNWPGPHDRDVELPAIIGDLYRLRAGMLLLELANERHRWEQSVFADHPLPAGMLLGAGVVNPASRCTDHPQTVAEQLTRIAALTGPGRTVAATGCGFSTVLGMAASPDHAERKLRALIEGARLASAAGHPVPGPAPSLELRQAGRPI
jgi:5-methyltetrahydropteroyltriglutamate--homocysteine methyltransferase